MQHEYILVERHSQRSRLNGVTMWRLVFYCLDDGLLYEMTVDNSYRNFAKSGWDHVVQDDCPWGVYTDLRRTRRSTKEGTPVLTADSPARITWRARDRDQALRLVEMDQRERNPDMFERLFS